jgi:hypothetical protein
MLPSSPRSVSELEYVSAMPINTSAVLALGNKSMMTATSSPGKDYIDLSMEKYVDDDDSDEEEEPGGAMHVTASEMTTLPVTNIMAFASSFLTQLLVLCKRTFLNMLRSRDLLVTQLVVALLVSVGLATLYPQLGIDIAGTQNRMGAIFFTCMIMAFGSLSTMDGVIQERELYMREVRDTFCVQLR